MRDLILIFVVIVVISSCSRDKKETTIEGKMATIESWTIEITKGETDTVGVKNWFPTPELKAKFKKNEVSNCLNPTLDFYPIELEEYIEEKLLKHLMLRANLFPPSPNIYVTNKHIVLAWDLTDYTEKICCGCPELEMELVEKLELKAKLKPVDIGKQISNEE